MKYKSWLACVLAVSTANASIINVPADSSTIQSGINGAVNGDTVLVQPGTYIENINFNGKNIVVGSMLLTTGEIAYISQTVINGDQKSCVAKFDQGEDSTAVLIGFTLTNGSRGGGIFCKFSSPTLTGLIIKGNQAIMGGGIGCTAASPKIKDVTVRNNTAKFFGGGVLCWGNANPSLENVIIEKNTARLEDGGGICCRSSSPKLANVTVRENSANCGGGIYFRSSSVHFDPDKRCNIYFNQADFGNDLYAEFSPIIAVILDTFTVEHPTDYYASPVDNFTYDILNCKVEQAFADLYVSPNGDNANGGLLPSDPLRTIAFSLLKICADSLHPRTIHLAEGTYSPSTTGERFPIRMVSHVSLSGESEAEVILDAQGQGSVLLFERNRLITIENLTITGGKASLGGGIYCSSSNPRFVNVTIRNNVAEKRPNLATLGGGMYCKHSSPTLSHVTISGNRAYGGGGLCCFEQSSPILSDVTISGNTVFDYGGGLFCGGNSNPILMNVTMTGNKARERGGGIFCYHSSNPFLIDTILWNNAPQEIYFLEYSDSNTIVIAYSDVQSGEDGIVTNNNATVNWLDGNIDADPLFVDAANGDFSLEEGSPCIDAGTAFFAWEDNRLLNLPPSEYFGSAPDMGAYEKMPNSLSVYPGDTDNNGSVDVLDILPIGIYYLQRGIARDTEKVSWSPNEAPVWDIWPATFADADGDGIVDEKDAIAIEVNWGNRHENASPKFIFDPVDSAFAHQHRVAFQELYGSLSGDNEAVRSMKILLKSILDIVDVPGTFSLKQNYPNPFNPTTTILFELSAAAEASLVVYDLLGREVVHLLDRVVPAGYHRAVWNGKTAEGRNVPSGIYIARLMTPEYTKSIKMMLLR